MDRVLEPEVMEGDDEAAAYDEIDRTRGNIIFQGFAESALQMGVRQGRVLDVGTGPGHIAIRLAKLNPALTIVGIDLSTSMLELATVNARRYGVTNVTFKLGDAKQIPYEDASFDMVICHQLLHQLPSPVLVLREIHRVVKPQGALLIRDVLRLSEPFMTLMMPLWCLGYNAKLREQTTASFRAGLTRREFRQAAQLAELSTARISRQFFTHQTLGRPAVPFEPGPTDRIPATTLSRRLWKAPYMTKP